MQYSLFSPFCHDNALNTRLHPDGHVFVGTVGSFRPIPGIASINGVTYLL